MEVSEQEVVMAILGRPVSWTEAGLLGGLAFFHHCAQRLMKTSSNRHLKDWQSGSTRRWSHFFHSSLCCCEPTVQMESYNSLKLVGNLTGIIVSGHQSNRLSGYIIWWHYLPLAAATAWIRSRSKVIEKQEEPGTGRVSQSSNI